MAMQSIWSPMPAMRSEAVFDHGAALRVPPPHDADSWRMLWMWLGDEACAVSEAEAIQVYTPDGPVLAYCGDWIVLSHSGSFHVAHTQRVCHA